MQRGVLHWLQWEDAKTSDGLEATDPMGPQVLPQVIRASSMQSSPHLSLVCPDGAHLCYALPCWYSHVVSLQKDMQNTSDCLLMQQCY